MFYSNTPTEGGGVFTGAYTCVTIGPFLTTDITQGPPHIGLYSLCVTEQIKLTITHFATLYI